MIASRALLGTTIMQASAQVSEPRRRVGIKVVGGIYFRDYLLDSWQVVDVAVNSCSQLAGIAEPADRNLTASCYRLVMELFLAAKT